MPSPRNSITSFDNVSIPAGVTSLKIESGSFSVLSITSASSIELTSGSLTDLGLATVSSSIVVDDGATFVIGDGGSVKGSIVDNGGVVIDESSAATFGGNLSGNGTLTSVGSGTVTLTGDNTYTSGTTVDAGTLIVGGLDALPVGGAILNNSVLTVAAGSSDSPIISGQISGTGALTIENGYLCLYSGSGLSQQSSVAIFGGSTLDVESNTFIVDYGSGTDPVSTILSYLRSGYYAGLWSGPGISSSTVANLDANQSQSVYSVGYADGADGIVSGLSSGQIEIMPTLAGDAKLQGGVGFGDFQLLAQYFGSSGGWDEGNFNYGGKVTLGDYQLLAQNFGASSALSASQAAAASTPAGQTSADMPLLGSAADDLLFDASNETDLPKY
jgi:fibronectin-binding autotransporter adhesin